MSASTALAGVGIESAGAVGVSAASLSDTALAYAQRSLSPATRKAYRSQLRSWEGWCKAKGQTPLPACPIQVANHLAEIAEHRSFATIELRLAAIVSAHALLGQPFAAGDIKLRRTLAGIARTHGTKPKRQAAPLLTGDAIRIASACGGDRRGLRDRALILLGFAGAFRRSELTAIRVDELAFWPHGLTITLPVSKGDQERQGVTVKVAANPLSAHCPVAALRDWIDVAGLKDGPLFRRVTRDGAVGKAALSPESARLILKARAEEAGFRGDVLARITPHSLRAGCITALARASVHERDIMEHSRHESVSVMRGYVRADLDPAEPTSAALWRRAFDDA